MDDQSRTADNIRCSVCGDPCFEGHGGTLHGHCPNDAGGSARYALECLVIGEGEQRRVYVITTEPPTKYAWIHDRWPLLTALKVE